MKEFSDGYAILTLDPRLVFCKYICNVKVFELDLCLAPQQHNRPTMKKCADVLWSIRMDNIELSTSDIPSRTLGKVARAQKLSDIYMLFCVRIYIHATCQGGARIKELGEQISRNFDCGNEIENYKDYLKIHKILKNPSLRSWNWNLEWEQLTPLPH